MRELIILKLNELKAEENNFAGENWADFFAHGWHISEYYVFFTGMPDAILLDFYNAVIIWNDIINTTSKSPVITDPELLDAIKHYKNLRNQGKAEQSSNYTQVMGRINRRKN